MFLPAVALLAYRKATADDSEEDQNLNWRQQLVREVRGLHGDLEGALRFSGRAEAEAEAEEVINMQLISKVDVEGNSELPVTPGESSFSSVARKEWIYAVFGKSLQQPKGKGLAQIDEYTCRSIHIPPLNDNENLGITLQRLTLGVYVRTVEPGSESEIAGVLPQSVLVKVNDICLLAEPSKQALERLLQYEGLFKTLADNAEFANPNLSTLSEVPKTKSDLSITDPVRMTFIKNGRLYEVLFLSCPPFGLEWAPCGNFALVKRNEGSHHSIPRGAIVASVNSTPIDDLDHTTSAKYLKEIMDSGLALDIKLCWPPPAARSGHWERQLLAQFNLLKEKIPARPVPLFTQKIDGVQVRVHSLFAPSTSSALPAVSGSISQWATLLSSGKVIQMSSKSKQSLSSSSMLLSKVYQPCPPLDGRLMENWKLQKALLFNLKYHWSINYPRDNSLVNCYSDIKILMEEYPKHLVQGILLPLMACCCCKSSMELLFAPIALDLATAKPSIVPAMELLAMALDSPQLRNQLERIRIQQDTPSKPGTLKEGNAIRYDNIGNNTSSQKLMTATVSSPVPMAKNTAPTKHFATKSASRFSRFRKKKKSGRKQLNAITNATDSSGSATQEQAPLSLIDDPLTQMLEEQDQREYDRQEQRNLGCRESLFRNTLLFIQELESICQDIELSLQRSFPQRIAGWALLPWSPNKDTALQNVTQSMRERLSSCQNRQFLNPLATNEMFVDLDPLGSFILPSAHFPLLLTFDCQDIGPGRSRFFGKHEALFRTKVEILSVTASSKGHTTSPKLKRAFQIHAGVGGTVKTSSCGNFVSANESNKEYVWQEQQGLLFDSRSSWGPPQTLSLRVSESIGNSDGDDQILSTDDNGTLSHQETRGVCWVDLDPFWDSEEDGEHIVHAKCLPPYAANQFDDHGELPTTLQVSQEGLEIKLRLTNRVIDLKSKTSPAGSIASSSNASETYSRKKSLLYKHDDDIRQEMFAIEFVKACDNILKSCGLDLKMLTFDCIPVGKNKGFIEWVHGCVPLSEIFQATSLFGRKKSANNISSSNKVSPAFESPSTIADTNSARDGRLSSVARAGISSYESLQKMTSGLAAGVGGGSKNIKTSNSSDESSKQELISNPIQDYLRSFAYDANSPYMIRKQAMDIYVKSCAGYCAITYILGVGDRHLDNLLLHQTGHFFHCDFSFILGNDPKKYLPLRISHDMVNGMGGRNSDNFCMFLSLTCAAFLTLRRPDNVRYLLSLVRMMEGFSLPDLEEKQSLETAILGIRKRLRLDLTEDEAISFMEKLVEDSCASRMWIAVDAIHTLGKRF